VGDALDRNAVIQMLARAIGAVAAGDDADARNIICDLAGGYARDRQQTLPGLPAPPPKLLDASRQAMTRLFHYWQRTCGHAAAKFTPDRAQVLVARMRDGYAESEIMCAIDGAAASAYVDKDSGKKFDDLTLICRNGSKLEDFIDRGVRAGSAHAVGQDAAAPGTSLESDIATLRSSMSKMHRDGRTTEYAAAARELERLLARRGR
jgi:hypothetical protein